MRMRSVMMLGSIFGEEGWEFGVVESEDVHMDMGKVREKSLRLTISVEASSPCARTPCIIVWHALYHQYSMYNCRGHGIRRRSKIDPNALDEVWFDSVHSIDYQCEVSGDMIKINTWIKNIQRLILLIIITYCALWRSRLGNYMLYFSTLTGWEKFTSIPFADPT